METAAAAVWLPVETRIKITTTILVKAVPEVVGIPAGVQFLGVGPEE